MRKSLGLFSFVFALSGLGMLTSANAQQGSTGKDPARWTIEDTTPKARYQTLKKEADAAYRENLKQCKSLSAAERSACTKEMKSLYQQDLARAKQEMNSQS